MYLTGLSIPKVLFSSTMNDTFFSFLSSDKIYILEVHVSKRRNMPFAERS